MDEQRLTQISVRECEELCDRLLSDFSMVTDKVALWTASWRMLAAKVGYDDPMLPAPDPHALVTPESKIAEIRGAMYGILKGRTPTPRACMEVFERINEV
jgi:hypothetical protein